MSMFKMPVFTWMTMITSVLIVLALPVLAVAGIQLQADRLFSMNFYNPVNGGDPVLWQHMFWLFGHPEVYILILPAMGIVSEILPVFSRKPLFGYPFCHLCGYRDRVHGLVRLEPSHVHGGPWPGGQLGICHIDHGDRHSNRRQGVELACDDVGRVASTYHADAICAGLHRHVHGRRSKRDNALIRPNRCAATGHLLRRCPLPLCPFWRGDTRHIRRHLHVVAEDVRLEIERRVRKNSISG